MRIIGLITLAISLSLIIGCSGPLPQRINLAPEVISAPRLPQSMPVRVDVNYPSLQLKIGTVADRLGNEVPVWVTDNIRNEIQSAMTETLTQMGVITRSNAAAQLSLTIDQLSYNLRSDGIRRELIGGMRLSMQVMDGNRRYQGSFESDRREEIFITPSEAKSQEFINALASDALFQALNDPEFTRFLIAGAR